MSNRGDASGLDEIRAGERKDITDANLRHANLKNADLRHADLRHANLRHADLSDANLRHANLAGADLAGANLRDANLRDANLKDANLRHANLWVANLAGADLRGANLRDARLPVYQRLPEAGSFTAFKGCRGHVVRVRVPEGADRVSTLASPECRAEYVEVVEVLDADGQLCDATEAVSWWDDKTTYREGGTVYPDDWDDDIREACTHGIHIYPTKSEAVEAVRDQ